MGVLRRAQLSLVFTDKELFENLIVPLKNKKLLHPTVVKCLTAYYYNPEVRRLIEGVEVVNTEVDTEPHINSQQESINNIRDILSMQNFLGKQLADTMEEGIEDFTEILDKVNQEATDMGVMHTTHNAYGTQSVKLLVQKPDNAQGNSENNEPQEVILPSDFAETITEMSDVLRLMKTSGFLGQLQESTTEEIPQETNNQIESVEIEDEEEEVVAPVKASESKPVAKRGRKKTTSIVEPVEEIVTETEPAQEEISNLGEASDALSELLDSL